MSALGVQGHRSRVTYRVVKQDGAWAYETNGSYSRQFRTREAARNAARLAAAEQTSAHGTPARPSENEEGQWFDDSG